VGAQGSGIEWSVPLEAGASSPVVDVERLVWVGTATGDVIVVGPGGTIQSTFHTAQAVKSSATRVARGVAVIGGADGVLYGLARGFPDADAGPDAGPPTSVARSQVTIGPIASSPAVGGDQTVYVTTTDGKLVAIAPDGMSVKWQATTNDTVGGAPAIDGTTIYVGSSDHRLYAFDLAGNQKWAYDAGASLASPAVGGEGTIYVGGADGLLHAVTTDGKKKWTYATGGPITGTPAVIADAVYVGSADKSLHAVSLADATKRWTYATLGAVATPIVGKDGTIYVGSADGHLYAITPGGSLFFAVNVKGAITSAPAISDDGSVYVTTTNALFAIGP
jgi:outer membrane protein assembly factor BamB